MVAGNQSEKIKKTVIVERDRKEASLHIDRDYDYNVTVTVYDRCHKNYTSNVYLVKCQLPKPTVSSLSTAFSPTPEILQSCIPDGMQKSCLSFS